MTGLRKYLTLVIGVSGISFYAGVLLPAEKKSLVKPRDPDVRIWVLDDAHGKKPMAQLDVWMEKGYSLQDVMKQMGQDLGFDCEARRRAGL